LASPKLSNADRAALLLGISTRDCQAYVSPFNELNEHLSALCSHQTARTTVSPMAGKRGWRQAFNQQPVFMVHRGEAIYSALLNNCADAPPVLFCQGDLGLLQRPAVAVVGSRRPSRDGSAAAFDLRAQLAGYGLVVVSGLAQGIDGHAHGGALSVGGATIAVMATGLDRIYPGIHNKLAATIAERGLLVTEFPPYVNPEKWHFPRRNRTLSGLCLGTVVVEAGRPSGSLLTATAAAEQGREVFAYPWSVYHKGGEGCRFLLGDGAQLAQSACDVVMGLGSSTSENSTQLSNFDVTDNSLRAPDQLTTPTLTSGSGVSPASDKPRRRLTPPALGRSQSAPGQPRGPASTIVDIIGDAVIDLPALCQLTGRDPSDLAVELAQLEIAGTVESTSLGYRLKRAALGDYGY
jgi:DNA protecting protein DprA